MNPHALYQKAKQFILRDLWAIEAAKQGRLYRMAVNALQTLSLAVHGYGADKCSLRAAWLTFVFMFSLAPTMAVGFSVAKGFNAQEAIKQQLPQWLGLTAANGEPNPAMEGIHNVLNSIIEYIEKTGTGTLGVLGMILLLMAAYKLLSAVERTMNDVWGVRRQRPILRKLVDYAAVVMVLPLMLVLTASVKIATLVTHLQTYQSGFMKLLAKVLSYQVITSFIGLVLGLVFATAGFWFLYAFFPNTRVRMKSAAVGAIFTAVAIHVVQWAFVNMQMGVSKANAVYGAFAAIPIFMLMLSLCWQVILFGAELSYAHANKKDLAFGGISFEPSPEYQERLALGAMTLAARAFHTQSAPLTGEEMALALAAPVRVMREVIDRLIDRGLLSEVTSDTPSFQPAAPLDKITLARIRDAIQQAGDESPHTSERLTEMGVAPYLKSTDAAAAQREARTLLEVVTSETQTAHTGHTTEEQPA